MSQNNKVKKALVTFSFDDGREDTYRNAYKVMKKYGLVGTIHVTTGWIDGTWRTNKWLSAVNGPMSIQDIQACYENGFEITPHGDKHCFEAQDLEESIKKLKSWGVVKDKIGFSYPNSNTSVENLEAIFNKNNVSYARAGRASRCYSLGFKMIYFFSGIMSPTFLFRVFNGPNAIKENSYNRYSLTSTVVKNNTTLKQIQSIIEQSIGNKSWNIFMFHSILEPSDAGYGQDAWYWDYSRFEELCKWLGATRMNEIQVVTIMDGINIFDNHAQ